MSGMSWSPALGAFLVLCGATPAGAAASWAANPIYVYYPRGDCRGGQLELEVWDRKARDWRRHPGHPRVPLETCQVEDAGNLFNEIRSRCVEPPDTQPVASWVVGLEVLGGDTGRRRADAFAPALAFGIAGPAKPSLAQPSPAVCVPSSRDRASM